MSLRSAVAQCVQYPTNEECFRRLDNETEWISLKNRRDMENFGVIKLAIATLKRDDISTHIRFLCWSWILNYVIIDDLDDENEYGLNAPMNLFLRAGGNDLLSQDFEVFKTLWSKLFAVTSWCSQDLSNIPEFIRREFHKYALVSINARDENLDFAISIIRAFSALEGPTRLILRKDGALEAVLPFLDCLQSNTDAELRRGFRTGSIVARLAGNDETGIGPQIIRGNPILVSKTVEILNKVLDAGPTGRVLNSVR